MIPLNNPLADGVRIIARSCDIVGIHDTTSVSDQMPLLEQPVELDEFGIAYEVFVTASYGALPEPRRLSQILEHISPRLRRSTERLRVVMKNVDKTRLGVLKNQAARIAIGVSVADRQQ